ARLALAPMVEPGAAAEPQEAQDRQREGVLGEAMLWSPREGTEQHQDHEAGDDHGGHRKNEQNDGPATPLHPRFLGSVETRPATRPGRWQPPQAPRHAAGWPDCPPIR